MIIDNRGLSCSLLLHVVKGLGVRYIVLFQKLIVLGLCFDQQTAFRSKAVEVALPDPLHAPCLFNAIGEPGDSPLILSGVGTHTPVAALHASGLRRAFLAALARAWNRADVRLCLAFFLWRVTRQTPRSRHCRPAQQGYASARQ